MVCSECLFSMFTVIHDIQYVCIYTFFSHYLHNLTTFVVGMFDFIIVN